MSPKRTLARRLDGYVRVSKVGGREGESFISPQAQRERIEAAARNAGASIDKWFTDLDESGASTDRPEFQKALERVEAGESDGIVVAKLDRFARSVAGAGRALERIENAKCVLIAADLGLDTSTPSGRLMRNVLMALAEFELERVRENWTTSRSFAARRGVHMAKPPTGYDRGDDGRLLPNRDAPTIAEAFRLRADGANWTELARLLDDQDVMPSSRKGEGRWSASSARALLRNRAYLGEVSAGDIVNRDAHLPLVTLAQFEAAQASSGSSIARSSDPALLAGLLRCEHCRHAMKPKTITGGGKVYRCSRDHSTGTCPAPATIYATVIEPHVESLLLGEAASRSYRPEQGSTAIDEAEHEVEAAENELRAWVTEKEILSLGRDVYVEGLQARQRRLGDAQARRRELFSDANSVLPSRAELAELWPTFTSEEKRRILGSVFDAIVVRPNGRRPVDERVVPILHGDGPADLPGRGRRVPFRPFDLPEDAGVAFAQDRRDGAVERAKGGKRKQRTAV